MEAEAADEDHQVAEEEAEAEVALAGTNHIVTNNVNNALADWKLTYILCSFELSGAVVVVGTEAEEAGEEEAVVAEEVGEMVGEDAAVETVAEDEVV